MVHFDLAVLFLQLLLSPPSQRTDWIWKCFSVSLLPLGVPGLAICTALEESCLHLQLQALSYANTSKADVKRVGTFCH